MWTCRAWSPSKRHCLKKSSDVPEESLSKRDCAFSVESTQLADVGQWRDFENIVSVVCVKFVSMRFVERRSDEHSGFEK